MSGLGSSVVGVRQGSRYTVGDLWRGVFLRSGNDAVHVLAAMNGGWRTTAQEMQETAQKLGAHDTTVKSPDGYDAPGQVSSAHDLTVFARAGLANEDFARYCATPRATFPGTGGATQIENTNRLLVGSHGMARYPGLIGVKNGYTTKAGNTLIAAARRNGRTLLVTVLNPQSKQYNGVYKEAAALLDWGFHTMRHGPAGGHTARRTRRRRRGSAPPGGRPDPRSRRPRRLLLAQRPRPRSGRRRYRRLRTGRPARPAAAGTRRRRTAGRGCVGPGPRPPGAYDGGDGSACPCGARRPGAGARAGAGPAVAPGRSQTPSSVGHFSVISPGARSRGADSAASTVPGRVRRPVSSRAQAMSPAISIP